MIKYIEEIDNNVLDIPILKEFRAALYDFRNNKNIESREKYYQGFVSFSDWYVGYCSSFLQTKTYSEKQIAECVFLDSFKTENQFKEYLLTSLYVSKEYVEYLKLKVTKDNIHVYTSTLTDLGIDLEWLIAHTEIYLKKSTSKISLSSSRRKNLTPTDIYSAARELFFIEE
jgi:hypothetical protein